MKLTRRRVLIAAVSAGVAGCSSGDTDSGPTTTTERTESESTGGEQTTDEETGSDDSQDDSVASLLQFGDGVPEAHRERAHRALARTQEFVGEELAAPVTIQYAEPGFLSSSEQAPKSSLQAVLGDMVHRVPVPDDSPGSWGQYLTDPRELTLIDPDEKETLVSFLRREAPADLPEDAYAVYPSETLISHELVHALQGDTIENLELGFSYEGPHYDGTHAGNSIHEGTATYVESRYHARCSNEADIECDIWKASRSPERTPAWAVSLSMWYVNGQVLVHHLQERHGWDGIWEAHRNPPEHTWAAMFPEQAIDEGVETDEVRVPDNSTDKWQPLDADHIGVNALYEKLLNLGQTSRTDSDAELDSEVTEKIVSEYMFRSELLRGWRADGVVAYEHAGDQRTAAHWRVVMASADDARALAEAFQRGYQDEGTAAGDGWDLDGRIFTVSRTDSTIDLWMAPDTEALETLRD
jgi:hypothetical protein